MRQGYSVLQIALHWIVAAVVVAAWFGKLPYVGDVHESAGTALVVVALGHAAIAVWHGVVRKDGTLQQMTRPG